MAMVGAVSSTACGSDEGSGECESPVLKGSPSFGADGTATLTGKGTLPDGVPDGLQLQTAVQQGNASIGVFPDDLFGEKNIVCGKTFQYTVNQLEAGTYRLQFLAFDPEDESTDPKFEGEAPADFTIADGQTLAQDTVFQLTTD
jgi:hypothetical protein